MSAAFPNSSANKLASQMYRWQQPSRYTAQIRYATVTAVSAPTVTITFAGSSNPIAGVRVLNSYTMHVNDVVAVCQTGSDLLVLGLANESDVPIGGVVASVAAPSVTTNYAAGTTNIVAMNANLVLGHQYLVGISCTQAQQITNPSGGINQIYMRSSALVLPQETTGLKCFYVTSLAVNFTTSGSNSAVVGPITAGQVGTCTFQVSTAVATNSMQVLNDDITAYVIRVG